jgi:hypothetical protein
MAVGIILCISENFVVRFIFCETDGGETDLYIAEVHKMNACRKCNAPPVVCIYHVRNYQTGLDEI